MTGDFPSTDVVGRHGPVGLLEGTELVGEFQGSGYRAPPQLVSRADAQLVRLPDLLYSVVKAFDAEAGSAAAGRDHLAAVARHVGRDAGAGLTVEQVGYLLDRKLAPLGVTTYSDGSAPEVAKPAPFLSLRFRVSVLSERATWALGGAFSILFRPAVLIAVLLAVAASELIVWVDLPVAAAVSSTLVSPSGILAVVALAVASTAFHEFGHASACRYGGVPPGTMGCGIYVVWPAFFTDITRTYRLDRAGRLRTDLGGVYFNGIFVFGLFAAYVFTGYEPLLVAILSVNLEIVQQLLPTLRFDGYYIVADLLGIPDLFKYIGPILARYVLRRPPDPRLRELKRWPQLVVTVWVLTIVPAMVVQLAYVAAQLPGLIRADYDAIGRLFDGGAGTSVLGVAAACVQALLLLLPVAGVLFILVQLLRAAARLVRPRVAAVFAAAPRRAIAGAAAVATLLAAGTALAWPRGPTGSAEANGPAPQAVAPPRPTSSAPSPVPPATPPPAPATSEAAPETTRLRGRDVEHRSSEPSRTSRPAAPRPAAPRPSPVERPSPAPDSPPPSPAPSSSSECVLGLRVLDLLC
ncbi:zinc metalloprotease [Amycolatopsis eburnea]|uniref:Peptide zinc metalloprotease protein n=1 Tax=Amycolatopsis eburnea TaxID=2267691 RepID=A0A3R9E3U9_9PSEU|nr:hypothetical protein [Amycolatopsis eburnea]RSD22162.1 hypothetical protein EIY87_10195 [Amycolatopsis eburnea]